MQEYDARVRTGGNAWLAAVAGLFVIAVVGAVLFKLVLPGASPPRTSSGVEAIPVEAAMVEHGPIERRRVFSGSLEPSARTVVASKIGGRVVTLGPHIADPVTNGQTVATLDDDEYVQLVQQAEADHALALAGLTEAESTAKNAVLEFERLEALHQDSIVSDSQLDAARAAYESTAAAVKVARARVDRAASVLEAARIRRSYTTVRAEWHTGDKERVVAERHLDEGDTVAAGTPMLTIIELDPVEAVIYVAETDYASLSPGQAVSLSTDAYPGRRWEGEIARIAPVFNRGSRQARVEVRVTNADTALKPGMFVRVEVVLGRVEDATIVPEAALTLRDRRPVVFVVAGDGSTARMVPVAVGIRDESRVQVIGDGIEGRVITLGQQLLGDGTAISLQPERDGQGPG